MRRRDGYGECFGSGHQGTREALLWAFDLGLFDPGASLRITGVSDYSRVQSALVQCFGLDDSDAHARVLNLPAVFELDDAEVGLLWEARDAMQFEVRSPASSAR